MSGIRTALANTQFQNLIGSSNELIMQKVEDFPLLLTEKKQNYRLEERGIMGLSPREAN
jgi:hypothetical protein